jgi:hypothetical protein
VYIQDWPSSHKGPGEPCRPEGLSGPAATDVPRPSLSHRLDASPPARGIPLGLHARAPRRCDGTLPGLVDRLPKCFCGRSSHKSSGGSSRSVLEPSRKAASAVIDLFPLRDPVCRTSSVRARSIELVGKNLAGVSLSAGHGFILFDGSRLFPRFEGGHLNRHRVTHPPFAVKQKQFAAS